MNLFNLIPTEHMNYNRGILIKLLFSMLNITFQKFFDVSAVIEWNKLDPNLRSTASLSVLKKLLDRL